ncbi:GH32 C-terminal domain-containing protein [Haloferax gibbonsii]|uniref:GH32 C-terminal domain-containing protein n=1 Tax=Haloferax gibbonsii TaxID=35746 RepID=UPI00373FD707
MCLDFIVVHGQDYHGAGWAHNGGLPVELTLRDDGRLGIDPIEELSTLRKQQLADISNQSVRSANEQLRGIEGDTVEIAVEFGDSDATKLGVAVRESSDEEERTLFSSAPFSQLSRLNRHF